MVLAFSAGLLCHRGRLLEKVPQESPRAASAHRRPAAAAHLPPFSSSSTSAVGAHRHALPIVILHRPGHIPFGPKIHKKMFTSRLLLTAEQAAMCSIKTIRC